MWWPFEDEAKDASGYDNDGKVTNGKAVEGKFGKAISFNGDGYVKVPQGKDFRVGHRHDFKSSDLIVWIRTESTEPIKVHLDPVGS